MVVHIISHVVVRVAEMILSTDQFIADAHGAVNIDLVVPPFTVVSQYQQQLGQIEKQDSLTKKLVLLVVVGIYL